MLCSALCNALVLADALGILCDALWCHLCCLHFVLFILWCFVMLFDALRCFVMHLWCCLGPGRNIYCVIYTVVWKCRELKVIKYKKTERVFAVSLLTAKPLPSVGWRQRRTRGSKLFNLATLGRPNVPGCRLCRQLDCGWRQRGDPRGSGRSSPGKYGPPAEATFAVS